MHIAYLDGNRLSRALVAGARRLSERAARLNAINVFPVPDGDTGTNMAGTARAMALRLEALPSGSIGFGAAMRAAADSALRGARGNSGAILAQFLHGLAEELEGEARIGTRRFAEAARAAARKARAALSKPREGTIVTVLTDWAEAAHRVAAKTDDFLVLLKAALEEARASLARTPDLLPELKKAGVVDAGAEGFVHILEGIWAYVSGGRLRDRARAERATPAAARSEAAGAEASAGQAESLSAAEAAVLSGLSAEASGADGHGESAFRYCTECLVTGEGIDLEALRSGLSVLGDSLVVAGSSSMARVHLHTDRPSAAFRLLSGAGSGASAVEGQKVDDMELQRRLSAAPRRATAVLTDTACDLPDALGLELLADRAAVLVEIGGSNYLDRDGLSSAEFFEILRADPSVELRSSQPSHAAFSRKLDLLLERADEVVYVGLSAALSGTLEGGRRAACEGRRAGSVRVVDTRSISVGAALVVRGAAEAAARGASPAEVEALAQDLASRSRLLVAVPDLSGLIRSGRLSGMKGLAARSLGLRPLITVDREGKAAAAGLYVGRGKGRKALLAGLAKGLRLSLAAQGAGASATAGGSYSGGGTRGGASRLPPLELAIGHADAPEEAAALARELESRYELAREILVTPVSPALAAHAGLGALALAYLEPRSGGLP